MKKYILTLLAVLSLCAIFCITAPSADAAIIESGICGSSGEYDGFGKEYASSNLTWTLDDQGTLTISGTGAMADSNKPERVIPNSGSVWWNIQYYDGVVIKNIVIEEGVTTIGDYAFYDCTSLISVTIPVSVTSIGDCAFDKEYYYVDGGFIRYNSLTHVAYTGTKAQWESISIGIRNNDFTNATRHYETSFYTADNCVEYGFYCPVCKKMIVSNKKADGSHSFEVVTVPATCTEDGSATKTCTVCGEVETEVISATGHSGQWVEILPASCTATGVKNRICDICGETEVADVPVIAHSFESVVTAPTCTKQGYTTKTCTACGKVVVTDYVPVIDHSYEYVKVGPFCERQGYTAIICEFCGDMEYISFSSPLGHDFGDSVDVSPTCTEHGTKSKTCRRCEYVETVIVAATGHKFETVVTSPTCTEAGSTTKTCTVCAEVEITVIAATGHSGIWIDLVPASCSEDGIRARSCEICDAMETENISAFGHSYSSVVTAPTCTQQGYTTKTCSNCGNVELTDYVSAKGHNWKSWITVKAATCTVEGTQMRFCNCGTTESKTIEKLPHSYENGSCTVCGAAQLNEKFDIDVARMVLGNALEFQFGVATTKIPDKTGYYAVIEKTWANGTTTTKTIPAAEWGKSGAYHAIVYDGLAAKEMGDTFYVTIYNADGVAVSNAKQDAVRDYVSRAFASQSAKGKTMMVDMLNYGAAAQVHFDYGTSDLANSKLTDEQKAFATAEAPEMSNDQIKGDFYLGSRFILKSRIQVQLAFANLTKDMYAIYTYTNAKGEEQSVRVEGEDFVVIGGKPAGVELSTLTYSNARALVKVTVYNADGTVYGTASDSIESCALRSEGNVFVALMKFADAAKAYLYG